MPKFLWTQRSNFGPSPRAFQGTAYDSNRRRVVLFGGSRNQPGTFFGDTWEWDGSYWTQMDDIGRRRAVATRCHTTAIAGSRFCSGALALAPTRQAPMRTTPGNGMAKSGRSWRIPVQALVFRMPWRSIPGGKARCCSAVTVPWVRGGISVFFKTPGNSAARIGPRRKTSGQRRADRTLWRTMPRANVLSCLAVIPPGATLGHGMARPGLSSRNSGRPAAKTPVWRACRTQWSCSEGPVPRTSWETPGNSTESFGLNDRT